MHRTRTQIRLAAATPPSTNTYMSHQPSDRTQYLDPCEDAQPFGSPLPIVNAAMTCLQKQLPSLQQVTTDPCQMHSPVQDIKNRHTNLRLHSNIQPQQRASNVHRTPQFVERSINSEAECCVTPTSEVKTCSGRVVKPPCTVWICKRFAGL